MHAFPEINSYAYTFSACISGCVRLSLCFPLKGQNIKRKIVESEKRRIVVDNKIGTENNSLVPKLLAIELSRLPWSPFYCSKTEVI